MSSRDDPPKAGVFEETVIMPQEALDEPPSPAPAAAGEVHTLTDAGPVDPGWPAFLRDGAPPAEEPSAPEAAPPEAPPPAVAPGLDKTLDDGVAALPEEIRVERETPVPPTVNEAKPRRWPIVVALLAALVVASGLYVYFGIWRYQPTAHRHVPASANVVVRAEASRLLLFKPVREHLWPLLLEQKDGQEGKRAARIEEETGVSIPTDLREVIVASVDGTAWVAIVGGNIESGRFVSGLFTVLKEEEVPGWRKDNGWLVHESGATIGQADDGTLILATHKQLAEACLPASDEDASALPVPTDGAIGFRVSHPAYKRLVALVPDQVPGDALKRVHEISGSVTLSDEPQVDLRLVPVQGVASSSLASELEALLAKLGLALLLVPGELYGAKTALSKARVGHSAEAVTVTAPWPYQPLDDAVRLLAKSLGGAKRSGN